MASLLTDPLLEICGRGPAPNKNFYYLTVNKSDVKWRWWTISLRAVDRYAKPGELRESHQQFLDNTWLQSEVSLVFGRPILQYAKALCQGHFDYLDKLPDSLLLQIINYLELEDVGQLARTSHRFKKLCGSEEFWEQAVRRRCNTVPVDVESLAVEEGWREIFFTSKLQLQKKISRMRLRMEEQRGRQVSSESPETNQTSSSEEECHHGLIGFDQNSCCVVDPDLSPEPEAAPDTSQ
ncbi:F-box only protein 36b [Platichthys flesus]|uniref:F-box only protein 36b n=1 Tax=Platichthys flesus TaxID=8260 RepID=UPI002DBBB8C8|nr:F-box only protein 36b [Platichthys flesus]